MAVRIRFNGFPHCSQYLGPEGSFTAGDEGNVPDAAADYLCETFPDAFARVEEKHDDKPLTGPPRSAAVSEPPETAAVPSPPRARSKSARKRRTRKRKESADDSEE